MTKPPRTTISQKHYVQSAVRFPPELRDALKAAADHNGRSFNAEVIARLRADQASTLVAELTELKAMLRKVLDAVT